jgi:flagellar motor switch protein FliG
VVALNPQTRAADPRAAAILLAALGEEAGAAVLRYLSPLEIRRAGQAMRELGDVPRSEVDAVLARYAVAAEDHTGLAAVAARQLDDTLTRALGTARAQTLRREWAAPTLHAIAELGWQPPATIAARLDTLTPPAQAVVLAALPEDVAAATFAALPDAQRADALAQLATSQAPSADTLAELDAWLAHDSPRTDTGEAACSRLLDAIPGHDVRYLLTRLAETDAALACRLGARQLRFEDLATVSLEVRRAFLQRVGARPLMLALKAAPPRLTEAVLAALSPAAAARLRDDLACLGQIPVGDIVAAQEAVLAVMREAVLASAPGHTGVADATGQIDTYPVSPPQFSPPQANLLQANPLQSNPPELDPSASNPVDSGLVDSGLVDSGSVDFSPAQDNPHELPTALTGTQAA